MMVAYSLPGVQLQGSRQKVVSALVLLLLLVLMQLVMLMFVHCGSNPNMLHATNCTNTMWHPVTIKVYTVAAAYSADGT
jgi:hypothetical protein